MKLQNRMRDPHGAPARAGTQRKLRALPEASEATLPQASEAALRRAVDRLVQQEKNRWACEIHDGLTQTVTAAVLELETLQSRMDRDPDAAKAAVSAISAEMRRALADIRGVLFRLSDEGAADAPASVQTAIDDVARRWNVATDVEIEGEVAGVPSDVMDVAQVVVHEALTNVAKHSSSKRARVALKAGRAHLSVFVEDHGRGLPPAGRGNGERHFGMRMMKRRVSEVGGSLDVFSSPGEGTRVEARLPIPSKARHA